MNKSFTPSAASSIRGVIYQIDLALLLLIDRDAESNSTLYIEKLDDITIDENGNLTITQVKDKSSLITNTSHDFWGTIRIWSELIYNKAINESNRIRFILITTQSVSSKSFIAHFDDTSPVTYIIQQMNEISSNLSNKENEKSYEAFNKLNYRQKEFLVTNIELIHNNINDNEIESKIKKSFEFALASHEERDNAYNLLMGWWRNKCICELQQDESSMKGIKRVELFTQIQYITKITSLDKELPIYDDIYEELKKFMPNLERYKNSVFIQQLNQIKLGPNNLKNAIQDYYLAYEHRARWVRTNNLITEDEESKYDNFLIGKWKTLFDNLLDDIIQITEESKKVELANELYKKFCIQPYFEHFLRNTKQDFILKGSYHMLSDHNKVRWHPDFESNKT